MPMRTAYDAKLTGVYALFIPTLLLNGLPVGAMLVGPWYGESCVYTLAAALERAS
ncbi:hypothetical protein [Halotalea alkalilenta]|uniref:hypothetical protein n=1 Tax=Halotalea alkalilenta TaxID=376489 RepID=UPI00168150C0|nr:hypothetical protein [Halotalea alkalilenta]